MKEVEYESEKVLQMGLVIFSFLQVVAPFARCAQTPVTGAVAVEMSVDPSRLTLHEAVVLNCSITNGSRDPIKINLGKDHKENFQIAITPPTGDKIRLPQLRKSGFGRAGDVAIPARERYSQKLVLNEWYSFSEAGLYEIEVKLAEPAMANGMIVGGQETFHTTVEIGPRNPEALAKRCEDLAAGIEASTSYERSAEGALALSYVTDPVAVPYLARALMANRLVEPITINGRERIATPEAVRALSPALTMNVNHASALARSALSRMESQSADPEVKQEIRRITRESANPPS